MELVPVEWLLAREADFDARRGRLPGHYNLSLVDEPAGGRDLKFYLLLTEVPDLRAGEGFTAERVFWSRYYWLRRYALVRAAITGHDAGLEQQAFQLLEYPHPACTPGWVELEAVGAAAGRDAAAELAWIADPAGPWPPGGA